MNKKALVLTLTSALVLPVVAFAEVDSIQTLMVAITTDVLWVVFGGIVVICFLISGITFLSAGGDPAKIKKARDSFLWGVVGVIVGIIAYSIINIVGGILG